MSQAQAQSQTQATPPWVAAFKSQLDGHEKDQAYTSYEYSACIALEIDALTLLAYAFATNDKEGNPKVRHVIHRFLSPTSNLLITTTDTRMAKPAHLSLHHTVELAWWIEPTAVQLRITGEAYALPNDSSAASYGSELDTALKGLQASGDEAKGEYWEGERKRLWKDAMSGHLRASFGRPTPGTPLDQCPDPKEWPERLDAESGDPEEKKKIDDALKHFALLAIRPVAFEMLELKPVPNKRTQWALKGKDEWEERRVAP